MICKSSFLILLFLVPWARGQQNDARPMIALLSAGESAFDAGSDADSDSYEDLQQALDDEHWQKALDLSNEIIAAKGRRSDAAFYWKAYALSKLRRSNEALDTIAELRKSYPQSKWLKEASALEVEVRRSSGQQMHPEDQTDEETKLLAINSLMNMECDKAVPLLENFLKSNNSLRLKQRALFVLAQGDCPGARQLVVAVAKGQSSPALQTEAIKYIGLNDDSETHRSLLAIYDGADSIEVKRAVLRAFLTSDGKEEVVAIAKKERDPELRREAIRELGAMDAKDELYEIYKTVQSAEEKEEIVHAMVAADDASDLVRIAHEPGDINVRITAIRDLGATGDESKRPALVSIYNNEKEYALRKAALEALFVQEDAHDLIEIARHEKDPVMRKEVIEKLAVMDDKEAHEYMIELLNK